MEYVQLKPISLKAHPTLNERWVQQRIVQNPSLLGLGDLVVKDEERRQPRGGRLDLLLADLDSGVRYEVELQLGPTDESHIIRTIEYWDLEKRRYPQYDHCAVIVAEAITARFLNVIALFNGFIPIIAIQLQAFEVGESVTLVATTVMDRMALGTEEEEAEAAEPTDRAYWESHGSKATLKLADELFAMVREVSPGHEPKYNKFNIGLAKDGVPNNFVVCTPRRKHLMVDFKIPKSEELTRQLEDAGIETLAYTSWGSYPLRLTAEDFQQHRELLARMVKLAHESFGR
jgi:hypothetical protein